MLHNYAIHECMNNCEVSNNKIMYGVYYQADTLGSQVFYLFLGIEGSMVLGTERSMEVWTSWYYGFIKQ